MSKPYEKRAQIPDPCMTLAEIADAMNISRERVRQIELRALGKLRRLLLRHGMTAEDFFSTLKYDKPIKYDPNADDSQYELIEPERKEDENN